MVYRKVVQVKHSGIYNNYYFIIRKLQQKKTIPLTERNPKGDFLSGLLHDA